MLKLVSVCFPIDVAIHDVNLRAQLCSGHYAFHNSVSLTRLQLPVLNSCLLFRLVYCPSNFQIVAIALMSLVKDTFCL